MHDARYQHGLQQLAQVAGTDQPAIVAALADISPDLAYFTVAFGYGDIYARPGLTPHQRQLATIAALAALGNARPQLVFHLHGALNVGCTPAEIVETLIHLVGYAGFPAALNGIFAAEEVLRARGITLEAPATPETEPGERYRRGWAALEKIDGAAGQRVIESLRDIAPDLGRYIVEFGFGDIYTRPGLDLTTREIVTVAALAAMGTALPQLKVHIHGLLNVGGTRTAVVETFIHIAVYAGFPAAINATLAAKEVLRERDGTHPA
ncbi:carboxymuconolactone decarboxylase family protein [Paludibacterium purpuratum]|uniref:4-carboxymuconolactone decarboxylase n=1 Tax=Paludibacterium purpuratum TaxID=1144873 RepID=A0A4R7B765_9NEIS|nr:carboxymuconolactone decarboxylase family protein [Paludibacterium purpuratum]TDR79662.1 4-carboxymuconolactone decarboxylase [Paludibacterium purpuratum]